MIIITPIINIGTVPIKYNINNIPADNPVIINIPIAAIIFIIFNNMYNIDFKFISETDNMFENILDNVVFIGF